MLKLYYVRHGLTEMNVQGLFAGLTETPLTAEGRAQATAAGKLARNFQIDLIVCSPMQRAHDTARLIAAEIDYPNEKILLNKLLIERDFGPLEGTPWSPDLNLDGISDIETDNTLIERAHLAYNWLQTLKADNILVVSAMAPSAVPCGLPSASKPRWITNGCKTLISSNLYKNTSSIRIFTAPASYCR